MPTTLVFQIVYPRAREELRSEPSVFAWLEALAAQGFYLADQDEPFALEQWGEALRTHSLAPGVTARAYTKARAFCAGESDRLLCSAYALQADFQVSAHLSYPDGFIFLSADDGDFTVGKERQRKYEWFLSLGEATYRVWHPLYGFLGDSQGNSPHTTYEDVQAREVRWLYDINLFGPEYVQKVGRDRLLSAPAWRVKPFDDGGVLLVPAPYIEESQQVPPPYTRLAVAQHLGLPYREGGRPIRGQ